MSDPSLPPSLLIVVVNYRTAGLTIDCLRSLDPEVAALPTTADSRVVVVDNASGDGSAETIASAIAEQGWSSWASLLPLEHNGGFASGNNAAIRPAMASDAPPRYVWLLNPDTVARPGALAEILAFMETHRDAGIAGSRLEDPDGSPQRSAFRFPSVLSELENGLRLGPASRLLGRWVVAPPVPEGPDPCPTDWVAGASMMIRREVFETIGLLDERFFMYFEEVDFCRRASRAGWPCWYVPRSRVVHLVGQSSGVTDPKASQRRRPPYWFDSRRRYFLTHHGRLGTAAGDLLWTAGFASYRLRRSLGRKPDQTPEHLLGDFVRHTIAMRLARR